MKTQASNSPLSASLVTERPERDAKKWRVAQEFESLFLQQMLGAMRKTIPEGGLTETSHGREIFTEMLDAEMAKSASRQGGVGLADLIYRQLSGEARIPQDIAKPQWVAQASYRSSQGALPARASQAQVEQWTKEAAQAHGVDPSLLRSLVRQESAGDSLARSPVGAQGLTQLMPATARELGVQNPYDGRENLFGGAKYLRQMLDRYQGQEELALAAYNAGPGNVDKYGGIPPFAETRTYVKKVLEGRQLNASTEVDHGG